MYLGDFILDFGMDFLDTIWSCVINFRSGLTKEFEGGDVTASSFYYFNNTFRRGLLYNFAGREFICWSRGGNYGILYFAGLSPLFRGCQDVFFVVNNHGPINCVF